MEKWDKQEGQPLIGRKYLGCGGAHATIMFEAARNTEYDYRQRRDGHRHHAMRANRSQCPRRVVVGGEARGLISLIPRTGEDERGPGRVGKAERHPDAWLTCRTPDYRSHSFRAARRYSLSHYHSGRASAKRYEERYDR